MKSLSLWAFGFAVSATVTSFTAANGDRDAATLNLISGYRNWTRVNSEPVEVRLPVDPTDSRKILPSGLS